MKEQANKRANNFFNDLKKNIAGATNVCKLGKIVKYYPDQMKADVLPMPSEDNAIIINVPVATVRSRDFLIYYPLEVGDTVVLLFVDNDTDNILLGEDSAQTERNHDISDCICIGGITLLTENLKVEDTESLVLQNIDNTASIVVKKDGDINIKAKHFKVEAERIDLN